MKDLNFEDELHFNEFPPVSTEEWEEVIQKDLKGKDYKETLKWDTGEGIEPLPFYRKEDIESLDHSAVPLTSTPNWSILEIIEDATPSVANERCLHALENGAGGLDIRLSSERITSKKDLEVLFDNIQIEIITIVFGPSISSARVTTWMNGIITDRNLDHDALDIHFSADALGQAALSGKLPHKEWLNDTAQQILSVSGSFLVDISPYANGGATIIQQLAFALATGNEYMGISKDAGLALSFRFSTGTLYFPEIAKYRAFRLLWKKVLSEYGVNKDTTDVLSETALWNKAQNDSHNNMLRSTTEAMSAAIGGCSAISIHRFDEPFNTPTPFASRIARNTQLILKEEAYLSKVSDPGAGSYYVEVLTEKIAEESWKLFQEIENNGGFYESLKSGSIQKMISESCKNRLQAYRDEKKSLIGVNKYHPDEQTDITSVKFQTGTSTDLNADEVFDITPVKPLYLEAELKMGDA